MTSTLELELVAARLLSPTVRELTLERCDGQPFGFVAGQWVNLHLQVAGRVERRAYSIASAPDPARPGRIELAVTRVADGPVSTVLHELELGHRLEVDGPHGFFTREGAEGEPALYVGTGTGLCPLRAMIQHELRVASGPKPTLLFGCRDESHLLWGPELEAWHASGRVGAHVTLSRPGPGWSGLTGYVQDHVTKLAAGAQPQVYICGLSDMVRSVRKALKAELGYDRRQIHSERYD